MPDEASVGVLADGVLFCLRGMFNFKLSEFPSCILHF